MIAVIEDGGYVRGMVDRLRELEARQDELNERLSAASADLPDIHPNIADVYRRKVARLAEALDHPEDRDAAASAIRELIDRIVLTPREMGRDGRRAARRSRDHPRMGRKQAPKHEDRHPRAGDVGLGGGGGSQPPRPTFDQSSGVIYCNPLNFHGFLHTAQFRSSSVTDTLTPPVRVPRAETRRVARALQGRRGAGTGPEGALGRP